MKYLPVEEYVSSVRDTKMTVLAKVSDLIDTMEDNLDLFYVNKFLKL